MKVLTDKAIENTVLYRENFTAENRPKGVTAIIYAEESQTLESAERLCNKYEKVALLNFANATTPGGGVILGANAQEEYLCRNGNLYRCLKKRGLYKDFYFYHVLKFNTWYTDRIIYSGGVSFFGENGLFATDVITSPAPNITLKIKPNTEKVAGLFESRIRNIFETAIENKAEALVLGAFGCGAFGNNPILVAEAFRKILVDEHYSDYFREIVFAVKKSQGNRNFIAFRDVFGDFEYSESDYELLAMPEFFPLTTEISDNNLYEITDSTVVSRITQTFPSATQAIAQSISKNAQKGVELFKLDIPSSALTKSKEVDGAFRAFSRGKNTITKNANLTKVNPAQLNKATAVANSAANIMNVGSLVVGQYYMSEINSKLEIMSKDINRIADFQNREFKSRIMSLISLVSEVSGFSVEVIENDETRNHKLAVLEDLKATATELLGQVNITIGEHTQNNSAPNYKEYQKIIDEFNVLVGQQNILIAALKEISKLTYLLCKGGRTSVMCYSTYNRYLEQSVQIRNNLEQWHEKQVKSLSIDLENKRISKSGVEGFFATIPAFLIDEKWKYRQIEDGLIQKISIQSQAEPSVAQNTLEIYDKDIEIVIKDGKYYYVYE